MTFINVGVRARVALALFFPLGLSCSGKSESAKDQSREGTSSTPSFLILSELGARQYGGLAGDTVHLVSARELPAAVEDSLFAAIRKLDRRVDVSCTLVGVVGGDSFIAMLSAGCVPDTIIFDDAIVMAFAPSGARIGRTLSWPDAQEVFVAP